MFVYLFLGKNSSSKLKSHDTGPFNFYRELKKLMLNENKEKIYVIAAGATTIQFIFSCFQNYEVSQQLCTYVPKPSKLLYICVHMFTKYFIQSGIFL